MEIHRFEKAWIAVSILLIVGFIATVTYGAVGVGVKMVDDSGGQVDPATIREGNYGAIDGFREPGVYRRGPGRFDVYVIARQFLFEPGSTEPIELPAGSRVTFHVTTPDVIHGFGVAGTNLNTMVVPGQVTTVTVRFEEPGEYGIVCNEYCGSGHHTMQGELVVVPASEYGGNA